MEFLHLEIIYYILPIVLIFFGFILSKKERELDFFSKDIVQRLRVSSKYIGLKTRNIIYFFITLLLLIALAQPVISDGTVEIKAKSSDIMIALDISDSMLAEDVYPNRLKLAKQKALSLLQLVQSERVGVIAFAKNSYLVSPLSFDNSAVSFLLKELHTDSITEKGTDFFSMLEVVNKSIKAKAQKILLLFTDGGDKKDFSQEITYAKKKNITIYIVAFGTKKGAPIKMSNGEFIQKDGNILISKLNDNIKKLATNTGGVYIESTNANKDMQIILHEIEKNSEKKELKFQSVHRYIVLFYYPLALALIFFLIASSSLYQKKNISVVVAFFLSFFTLHGTHVEAGVLDFMEINQAKEAYSAKKYVKSAKIYEEYANKTGKAQSYYNAGNALYKEKKYKEAVTFYEKAHFTNEEEKAKKLANLGNAHCKVGGTDNLKKAKKAYEASLKIKKDNEVQENLEKVLQKLKKKKEQKKEQKKKQDKEKKKKQEKNKDKKQENGKKKQKNEKEKEKNEKEKQEKKKNNDKQEKNTEKKKDSDSDKKAIKEEKIMSKEEEKKWLKKLNKQRGTFLYRLNETKAVEEHTNEKPW